MRIMPDNVPTDVFDIFADGVSLADDPSLAHTGKAGVGLQDKISQVSPRRGNDEGLAVGDFHGSAVVWVGWGWNTVAQE